ncbi:MAG: hypothetical protein OEZ34_16565 [Spirochaetia bacterium]|nr:hypothetical protein [Spirochaetia bacterium]
MNQSLKSAVMTGSFILTGFFLFISFFCTSASNVRGGKELEGWRVEEGQDVFYMNIVGRASERAVNKDDPAMKKTTCVESTGLQAKDKVIKKVLGEHIEASSSVLDGETQAFIIDSMRKGKIRGVQMKECASRDDKWLNCECVYYIKGPNLKKSFIFEIEKAQEEYYNR